jgi:hypothetical protein
MEGIPMVPVMVDEKELLQNLDQAINECAAALPPEFTWHKPFERTYGPGVRGLGEGTGTFSIWARRYVLHADAETIINVLIGIDDDHREKTPKTSTVETTEQFLLNRGAFFHNSAYRLRDPLCFVPNEPSIWHICAFWSLTPWYR